MLAFTHRYHSIRLSFSLWLFFHLRSYKREVFRFFAAAAAAVHCSSSVRLHFFVDNIFTLATHNRNIYRRQFSFVAECVWCCVFFVYACTQIRSNFLHYGFSYKPIHCSCHIKTLGALIIVIIIMIIILNDSLFFLSSYSLRSLFLSYFFRQMEWWWLGWFAFSVSYIDGVLTIYCHI